MEKFLEGIESYDILNNLLPGAIVCLLWQWYTNYQFPSLNIIAELCIFYFVGLVVGRIGSLIIEPIYKKLKIISTWEYRDFVKSSQNDSKIDRISSINNMYRTFSTAFILITFFILFHCIFKERSFIYSDVIKLVVSMLLVVLFSFSYRKQSAYVQKRINQKSVHH